ncbi:MAG: protein-L-isoaspartate(D-aspartate) O-methyltransferase [Gemmatimonadetes bacterium]|nr:protein-L-isoaspartate(D-aspartate) O-methyltransferase [Gemmatimonadota bacterium]
MIRRTVLLAAALAAAAGCAAGAPAPPGPSASPPPAVTAGPSPAPSPTRVPDALEERFRQERESMVARHIEARGIEDPRVLDAMRSVPRHRFVPERYLGSAYADHPLPIGEGQTISQPYIVALMSELLQVEPGDRVLEIGTGSGYQAAVLAEMGAQVYSVEIIPVLAASARRRLDDVGYTGVVTATRDGYYGWEVHAPFDAIIVTAAPDHVPPPLLTQVKPGGRLVIPAGPTGQTQTLWLMVQRDGEWVSINQGGVIFVPLTGGP